MKRNFLTQFINKVSEFPTWAKEIIYNSLSKDVGDSNAVYLFASYKPVLTYKGRCELDFKNAGFDMNIYNILQLSEKDYSISEISLNTFLSIEEVARYFLFCVDEGYLEIPENSQIHNLGGFIAGKYRTGEYFVNSGNLSEDQLEEVINKKQSENSNKKLGEYLLDCGFVSKSQLDMILKFKQESTKRFILDYNEVPAIKSPSLQSESEDYRQKYEQLKVENKQLKTKLEQLLVISKKTSE